MKIVKQKKSYFDDLLTLLVQNLTQCKDNIISKHFNRRKESI